MVPLTLLLVGHVHSSLRASKANFTWQCAWQSGCAFQALAELGSWSPSTQTVVTTHPFEMSWMGGYCEYPFQVATTCYGFGHMNQ